MKVNENTAIATADVLLVPYEARHVPTYHAWMEDAAVREATASERLTLAAEHENQQSWRAAGDKLTFIVCRPAEPAACAGDLAGDFVVVSGRDDAPERMVGDINLFVSVHDDGGPDAPDPSVLVGEIDVMVARAADRGQGIGRAAVAAFLHYIGRHADAIVAEASPEATGRQGTPRLHLLMAKIQATNVASLGLFRHFGFVQEGDVNYFGEVTLVRPADATAIDAGTKIDAKGYTETTYVR